MYEKRWLVYTLESEYLEDLALIMGVVNYFEQEQRMAVGDQLHQIAKLRL